MLSRIRVSYKLLLIYSLDMVAVAFLAYSLASEQLIAIDFAAKELVGNSYLSTIRDTISTTFTLDATLTGGTPEATKTAATALTRQLDTLQGVETQLGADLNSAELQGKVQSAGRALVNSPSQALVEQTSNALAALTSRVGDTSNLILDPDLDSYYTMSLVLLRFSDLSQALLEMNHRLLGFKKTGVISSLDETSLLLLSGRLRSTDSGTASDFAAGVRGNPDGSMAASLQTSFNALFTGLAGLETNLDHLQSGPIKPAEIDALLNQLAPVRTQMDQTWRASAVELDHLLNARKTALFNRMVNHFAIAVGLLVVILSLVFIVARNIAGPVAHLAKVAEEVRNTSNFSLRANAKGTDEFGRLAEAFNAMLERLQGDALREQEIAARTRAAEAQQALVETIPIPLFVTRASDGTILRVNDAAAGMLQLGSSPDGMRKSTDVFTAEDRARMHAALARDGEVNDIEMLCTPVGGTPFWAMVSVRRLSFQNEEALLTTVTSIHARKAAEEQLRSAKDTAEHALEDLKQTQANLIQAEKLASLGGLVAGVAHEINTPVGVSLTAASTLALETEQIDRLYKNENMGEEDFKDYLNTAGEVVRLLNTNLNRAASLIQSFKQVAVDQVSDERRQFLLGEYIEEVLTSLAPSLRRTQVSTRIACPAELVVDTYPGSLSQVLTNFVVNTVLHAFEEGGNGSIDITVDQPTEEMVRLRFVDDGKGIPAENLPRIFDPFFTTKRSSGGSGLGLHIVFNIISRSLQGSVTVESTVGVGTTFTVLFPRVAPHVAEAAVA